MKRNLFLRSIAAMLPLSVLPIRNFAFVRAPRKLAKGFQVKADTDRFGKPITLFEGDTFYTKVSSKDTNGDLYMFESTRLKKGGPIAHFHYSQDEIWFITEGEFTIKIGDDVYQAKPGDTVFGPRGVPHSFSKTSEGPAKMIITFQPAGKMEEFFIAVAAGIMKNTTPEQQETIRRAHGFESTGDGVGYLKKF